MIDELLSIYEEGRTNPGTPECMFAETLIFNEGWMLRAAIHSLRSVQVPAWMEGRGHAGFRFLPFPPGITVYSEAQLYTPFRKRARVDRLGEGPTHTSTGSSVSLPSRAPRAGSRSIPAAATWPYLRPRCIVGCRGGERARL